MDWVIPRKKIEDRGQTDAMDNDLIAQYGLPLLQPVWPSSQMALLSPAHKQRAEKVINTRAVICYASDRFLTRPTYYSYTAENDTCQNPDVTPLVSQQMENKKLIMILIAVIAIKALS